MYAFSVQDESLKKNYQNYISHLLWHSHFRTEKLILSQLILRREISAVQYENVNDIEVEK